jgi:hypothetical protein
MQRAVAELGFCDPPQRLTGRHPPQAGGGSPAWAKWAERWHGTPTLTPRVRDGVRATLLKAGRWLEAEHPEAADPARWTRQTCAAWIAALDRMQHRAGLPVLMTAAEEVFMSPAPGLAGQPTARTDPPAEP